MTKYSTKRALIVSVLALAVCVSMLIGTTFAWFTDNATTGSNVIKSGKLDVVFEMKDDAGEWVSAEGATLNWVKAAGAPANEEVLWEPGCTYVLPELRIRNAGNLALKYQVQITGFEGDEELLDAIEFTGIPEQNVTESLLPGAAESFVIKGHMDENAGNEYQNLTLTGVAITVYATQYTYEYDSEDNQYDAGA